MSTYIQIALAPAVDLREKGLPSGEWEEGEYAEAFEAQLGALCREHGIENWNVEIYSNYEGIVDTALEKMVTERTRDLLEYDKDNEEWRIDDSPSHDDEIDTLVRAEIVAEIVEKYKPLIDEGGEFWAEEIFAPDDWEEDGQPIASDVLKALGMTDCTDADPEFFRSRYEGNGHNLGLYRDSDDYYWEMGEDTGKPKMYFIGDEDAFHAWKAELLDDDDDDAEEEEEEDRLRALTLEEVKDPSVDLTYSDFRGLDLSGVNLSRRDLKHSVFDGCDMRNCDLEDACITHCSFDSCNFSGKYLGGYDFSRTSLQFADFSHAKLGRAIFWRADLYKANLYKANLCCANFDLANMHGANLDGASLDIMLGNSKELLTVQHPALGTITMTTDRMLIGYTTLSYEDWWLDKWQEGHRNIISEFEEWEKHKPFLKKIYSEYFKYSDSSA